MSNGDTHVSEVKAPVANSNVDRTWVATNTLPTGSAPEQGAKLHSKARRGAYWTGVLIIGLSGAIFAFRSIDVYDLWLHLGIGKWIVQNGAIPTRDVFSHTIQGKPWVPHEWLSQVIFYLARIFHRIFGFFDRQMA
ncbi:MAG TPA: hypothetical protein VMY06_04315 [Sedimentisphaerales bacterium]|nr:hypothetical protein [Sedimentisphaerales bacterium]